MGRASKSPGGSSGQLRASLLQLGARPAGLKAEAVPLTGSPAALAEALLAFATEDIAHFQVELQSNSLAEIEALACVLHALDQR